MVAKTEDIHKSEVPVRNEGGGLTNLHTEIDRLLDRFTGSHWPAGRHWRHAGELPDSPWSWDPFAGFQWSAFAGDEFGFGRADLSETDDGYELQIDLPGMKKDDIKIELSDGVLTISGERSDEREEKRKGYYLSERSHGAVWRSFRVPESVKVEDIKARFKDGVLTLAMRRTEEARRNARTIDVE